MPLMPIFCVFEKKLIVNVNVFAVCFWKSISNGFVNFINRQVEVTFTCTSQRNGFLKIYEKLYLI